MMRLTFYGGAGTVTGANFHFDTGSSQILVDVGLQQTAKVCDDCNYDPFPYDPAALAAVVITHAHLDHIGRLPLLVKHGYRGAIYATAATKALTELMLEDGAHILEEEARKEGKEPLYTVADVEATLGQWETLAYHEEKTITPGVVLSLRDAGHILGSAIVTLAHKEKRYVVTGDLGNPLSPILPSAEAVPDADYLIMESVYGDRVHEPISERREILEDVFEKTVGRNGVLLIPAFSLERTQVLLSELNTLVEGGRIPTLPVFLDSPLAIRVTKLYRTFSDHFNEDTRKRIADGDDIFAFPGFQMTESVEESKAIQGTPNPKVIIAGSGMSNGGRILHHEKNFLPQESTTLLIVGYQAAGSLGRSLQEGAKEVTIFDKSIPVNARVETLGGYSAHMDSEALLDFAHTAAPRVQKIFCAMGEPASSMFLAQRIRDYLGVQAVAPEKGQTFDLE